MLVALHPVPLVVWSDSMMGAYGHNPQGCCVFGVLRVISDINVARIGKNSCFLSFVARNFALMSGKRPTQYRCLGESGQPYDTSLLAENSSLSCLAFRVEAG